MKKILADVQSGDFAREWVKENASGAGHLRQLRDASQGQPIEKVGAQLREMMPWIREQRLVDRSRN